MYITVYKYCVSRVVIILVIIIIIIIVYKNFNISPCFDLYRTVLLA